MTYLARVTMIDHNVSTPKSSKSKIQVGQLEEKVLNTNPLLEAFGNAKTLRFEF